MMSAEEYARAKTLLCSFGKCRSCPLSIDNQHSGMNCQNFIINFPAEAVKLVEIWWLKNKERFKERNKQ